MNTTITAALSTNPFLSPGDLEPFLLPFIETLANQGFTPLTIRTYFDAVAHFGTWLQKTGLTIGDIDTVALNDFANHHCHCPGARQKKVLSRKYVNRVKVFLAYLVRNHVISVPKINKVTEQPVITQFSEHLQQRGLKQPTASGYKRYLTMLLLLLGKDSQQYDAALVRSVIFKVTQQRSCSEAKKFASVLRTYLRFLAIKGLCIPDLANTVLTVAQWKLSSIPRYLVADDIERVIATCDMAPHQGLRDRAIILLLARLGLRAGDIINLCTNDIHWSAGTITVSGKGRREERLPLPQEVGDALLAYLKKARPVVPLKQLFICLNAPYRAFSTSACIADIVRAALLRAGIDNPQLMAHIY